MSGKIVAPASAARYMLRMWILFRFRGVSRTQSASGRFSFSHTSAARSIKWEAVPWATRDRVPTLQRDDHHGIGGIGTAGYVGADIVIRLLLDFRRSAVAS